MARPGGATASSRSRSASVIATSSAPRLPFQCSSVRGPTIGAVIPGCDMFHASASWPGLHPFSSAMAETSSNTANAASLCRPRCSWVSGFLANRVPGWCRLRPRR